MLPIVLLLLLCCLQFLPGDIPGHPQQASAGQLQESADAGAGNSGCLRQGAVIDLEPYKKEDQRQQGTVPDPTGIVLEMQPLRCPNSQEWCGCRLAIWYQGKKVREINTEGWFTGYSRYEKGSEYYFVIEDFSGGAHCCVSQHILFLSGDQQSVKYLGDISLEHGGPGWYDKNVLCRNGHNYLKVPDWRFAYFYTSFAQSFPFMKFYLLTPAGLHLDNKPFRDLYVTELTQIKKNIQKEVSQRAARPPAIISRQDQAALLSDDLAVLLVERTVNLICAGEEAKAWQDLHHDVKKYYRSSTGLEFLKRQIKQEMAKAPY